jgi:DNA polymerase III delta subunit
MRVEWGKAPPVLLAAGTEHYIRARWVRHTLLNAYREGFEVVFASSDAEAVAALSMADTFSLPTVILISAEDVEPPTVEGQLARGKKGSSTLLIQCADIPDTKKYPSLMGIPSSRSVAFKWPAKKAEQKRMAERFVLSEAARWMKTERGISPHLAEKVVAVVGSDLGTLSWEVSKASAFARSQEDTEIKADHIRKTLRSSPRADMQPLREALARADSQAVAKALRTIKAKSPTNPTMLLLRSRGGPADLAYQWLHASVLVEQGCHPSQMATLLGVPEWAVTKTILPAVKRWGREPLKNLVRDLAYADRGILRGVPAPWVACQSALLRGCLSVGI